MWVTTTAPDDKKTDPGRQPYIATLGLISVTIVAITGIVLLRMYTGEIPVGLVSIASLTAGGLVMSSGKRRF